MGDGMFGKAWVDARVAPGGGVRMHRRLRGLSGMLLFACMFLPAVKGCHEPVTPAQVPPFLPPYLYGLVFALIAISRSSLGLVYGVIALRALAAVIVLGSIVVVVLAPLIAIIEMIAGAVLLVTVGLFRTTETRVAATGIVISVVSIFWFGIWSVRWDAFWGVYLSLGSSIGLLAGCVAWLRELVVRPPVDMPRAIAVARYRQ
jgi:hypothetical protein